MLNRTWVTHDCQCHCLTDRQTDRRAVDRHCHNKCRVTMLCRQPKSTYFAYLRNVVSTSMWLYFINIIPLSSRNEITDIEASLILFTCKFYSMVRARNDVILLPLCSCELLKFSFANFTRKRIFISFRAVSWYVGQLHTTQCKLSVRD